MEKVFCSALLKRPTRISLKRLIKIGGSKAPVGRNQGPPYTHKGLAMMTPSTVGVPAVVLSITSFRRSPAAAMKDTGAVVNSVGVVPAVPPPWTGLRS